MRKVMTGLSIMLKENLMNPRQLLMLDRIIEKWDPTSRGKPLRYLQNHQFLNKKIQTDESKIVLIPL
jgi:hypothetical protein